MKVKFIDNITKPQRVSLEEYLDGRELVIEQKADSLWVCSTEGFCPYEGRTKAKAVENLCNRVSTAHQIVEPPSEWSIMDKSERVEHVIAIVFITLLMVGTPIAIGVLIKLIARLH